MIDSPIDSPLTLTSVESRELARRLQGAVGRLDGIELELSELRRAVLEVVAVRHAEAPTTAALDLAPPFLADFCLAHACRRTPPVERAWALVVERFSRDLLMIARASGDGAPEDVVSGFFGELWIVRRGQRSLLDTYMGLGPLRSWMALVLRRQLARASRSAATAVFVPLSEGQAARTPSAEERLLRRELLATVRPMLDRFLDALSDRDRDLVEARVLRRERGVDTARRFGVSPAYVSRRFKEVVLELRERLSPSLTLKGFDPEDAL